MQLPHASARRPRGGALTSLTLIVLSGVLAVLLLAPAAASAKVDKIFAAKYAAHVMYLVAERDTNAEIYDDETNNYEDIYSKVEQYKAAEAAGDTQAHMRLVGAEAEAAICEDFITSTVEKDLEALLANAKAFYRNNYHYFSKEADRTKLRSGCDDWEDGVRVITWAFRDLASGFNELSDANLDEAAAWAAQANEKSSSAAQDQTLGLGKLRALRR
jgi:hypothetical protein